MTFPLRRCKDMQKKSNHQIFLYQFIFHRLNTGFFLQAALRYTLPSPHSAIVSRASAREESTPSLRCSLFRPSVTLLPPLSSPPFLPPRSSPSFFPLPPCPPRALAFPRQALRRPLLAKQPHRRPLLTKQPLCRGRKPVKQTTKQPNRSTSARLRSKNQITKPPNN